MYWTCIFIAQSAWLLALWAFYQALCSLPQKQTLSALVYFLAALFALQAWVQFQRLISMYRKSKSSEHQP